MSAHIDDTDSKLKNLEDNLRYLLKDYSQLRQRLRREATTADTVPREYISENRFRLYPIGVGLSIAIFLATFLISLITIPMLSYNLSDTGRTAVIVGISAGIVTTITFVVGDNIRTQRLNEKLAAKSHEIKMQRSDILTYLQGTLNKEFSKKS